MSNEESSKTEAPRAIAPNGFEFGNAVARVVAEHTGLKPYEITELHVTSESIVVNYGLRMGPSPDQIQMRTRTIDLETGETKRDMPRGF